MYSIDVLENLVPSLLPASYLPRVSIQLFGWNRTKEGKSDPELITLEDKYSSMTNQSIGCFPADVKNWNNQCWRAKVACQKEEVGVGMRLQCDERFGRILYLAMVDFNPGLEKGNRHTVAFWKDLESRYSGKRMYLFDSGNAYHGLLTTVMDTNPYLDWIYFLESHEEVVDQKWIKFALTNSHGGVIRMTAGRTRPQPRLWKWVNL